MNYYKLALATGLTHDQALIFATAMTHNIKPNIYHLTKYLPLNN